MAENTVYDVVVVGGGPGGYHAAIRAAQCGLSVALVEKDDGTGIGGIGGVCLNWGCIPSKSLLKNAELVSYVQEDKWGLEFTDFKANIAKAVERSRSVSEQLTKGVEFLLRKNKIKVYKGKGVLQDSSIVKVDDGTNVTGKNIVIATGASPRSLPGMQFDGKSILSYREALELKQVPDSIAIVGASAIGCELAYFFNAYGAKVTLFESEDRLVPKEDKEISAELARRFKRIGITAETSVKVSGVKSSSGKQVMSYEAGGKEQQATFSHVLLGVGVTPNTADIGLDQVKVEMSNGYIKVDGNMRTNINGVYAVGDVTGLLPLAHVAFEQGVVAAETIAGRQVKPLADYHNIPRCIYCQPEIASVGYTEDEARAQYDNVKCVKVPYTAAGKSIAVGHSGGFIKLVVNTDLNEVVGTHIIGSNATEMIATVSMLSFLEGTTEELHRMVYAHPTLSELLGEAGGALDGLAIHM